MAANKEDQPTDKAAAVDGDGGVAEVQARVDRETEQGFRGVEVDPTPNEHYTLQGVTEGLPTPETDEAAAEDARRAHADVSRRAAGAGER